jgi:hypothetical protein
MTSMRAEVGFVGCLILTLVLLGFVVWTGLRARRALHLSGVAATVAALGLTILFALRMGTHYDLAAAGWITSVHHALARTATLAYLAPLITGALTIRDARWRPIHRRCAFVVLGLTVLSALTGTWMLLAAPSLSAV